MVIRIRGYQESIPVGQLMAFGIKISVCVY